MLYIGIALVFYTTALMLGAVASRNLNTNLVALISNVISVIIPILVVSQLLGKRLFENSTFGIVMAILSGVAISIFTLALSKSFQVNKVAIVTPILYGGTIFLTSVLSYIFFKEKITLVQLIGLLFVGVGIITITYAAATGK